MYSKKILYLLSGIFIFSIIKIIPNNTLNNLDIILISSLTILLCAYLEKSMISNICPHNNQNIEKFNLIESLTNMTNPPATNPPATNPPATNPPATNPPATNPPATNPSEDKSVESDTAEDTEVDTATEDTAIEDTATEDNTDDDDDDSPDDTLSSDKLVTQLNKLLYTSNLMDYKMLLELKNILKSLNISDNDLSSEIERIIKIINPINTNIITAIIYILNTPNIIDTKLIMNLKQLFKTINIETDKNPNQELTYPFTKKYMSDVLKDTIKAKSDNTIIQKIQLNSKNNIYYEILIQLIQTDINLVYQHINKDYNKLNEIIMNIKFKRENPIQKTKVPSKELSNNMNKYIKQMADSGKYIDNIGFIQNMVDNDMRYSMYTPKQHEKLGTNDSTFTNKWDNDYALLNTDKWRPEFNHSMYKCKAETTCPVCPNLTKGYPVKLKDFDLARKILPPDVINIDYIKEKLVSGLS
jgi:hypothetical protein